MSLKGKFSNEFNPKIRDRGVAYFRSNSVTILSHSDSAIDAQVKGKTDYLVRLSLSGNTFAVACTCPYFEGGEECKHIWATMLAADNANYLSAVDQQWPLRLAYDDHTATELHKLLTQNNDLGIKEQKPEWQQQLTAITNAVKSTRVSARNAWPE